MPAKDANWPQAPPAKNVQPRRPYTPPTLVSFGSVAKLTQGSAGSAADGGSGMFMPCL